MLTNRQARMVYMLFPLLLIGVAANNASAENVGLPYTPPLGMFETGHVKSSAPASYLYGQVKQTMKSGGYTYVLLDTGKQKIWAAGPITSVKKGDDVRVSTNMPMHHFHSKSLKRDFDLIYFSNTIMVAGGMPSKGASTVNPHRAMQLTKQSVSLANIRKAKNGKDIAEIYRDRKQLAGKQIRVRGKVVKYIANINGKNWLHIMDESSQQDLLVITSDKTNKDIVLAKGTVVLNKDNGIGHIYPVAIENAKIIKK